jgi:hypothetical protein
VDRPRFLGPEAGDPKPVDHARGHLASQLVEIGQRLRRHERRDLVDQRRADSLDGAELPARDQLAEIVVQAAHDARCVRIRARLECVFPEQLEEHADLIERVGDLRSIHHRRKA